MTSEKKMGRDDSQGRWYFIKRPVFDLDRNIWGYEVFRKECPLTGFAESDGCYDEELAPEEGGCDNLSAIIQREQNVILDICDRHILAQSAEGANPAHVILKIQEKLYSLSSILTARKRLKDEEYRVSIAPSSSFENLEAVVSGTDLMYVDVFEFNKERLRDVVQAAERAAVPLLAGQVAGRGHQAELAELGFTLFTGPFYKEPEIIAGKKLTSTESARFNLFRLIERAEPDFNELADTLQADVGLTLKLFSFLNSAFFGFPTKIKSIHQAVTLLGWDKTRSWLRIILMENLAESRNVPELLVLSVQRGKFLEVLAKEQGGLPDQGVLSLLGTLSCLDAILQIPFSAIAGHLPLDDELKGALVREKGNKYLPLLKLAECVEDPAWPGIDPLLAECGVEFDKVALAVYLSTQWVEHFFQSASSAAG